LRPINLAAEVTSHNRAMFSPTAPDIDSLRLTLKQRAETLKQDLRLDRSKIDASRGAVQGVSDRKDQADVAIQAGVDDAEFQRDLAELAQVEAALQRLETGRFGWCEDCGEAIAAERLGAQPWAARCLSCQSRREQRP
jgi:RNA polymerase-binding transcription factor DksA